MQKSSKKIRNLIDDKNNAQIKYRTGVYEISSVNSRKNYVGKTSRLKKQIYEHIRDLKKVCTNNGLVRKEFETYHNFNFDYSKMSVYIHNKNAKKIVQGSITTNHNTIKQKPGFFQFLSLFGQIDVAKL